MSDDVTFSHGPAKRPAPRVTDPLLQWASGLQTHDKRVYAGWLCEHGKHDDLDRAMQEAGFETVMIKHGTGNIVKHWALPCPSLFVLTDGVQSLQEMATTPDRVGIAFGWVTLQGGRQQSQLRCRVLVQELLIVGYTQPLVLTLKGTVTGDFVNALTAQFAALDAIEGFRKAKGKPPLGAPFYALSLPIGPGADVKRGSGGQVKEIAPPCAQIPDPVTKEYIADHWAGKDWIAQIEPFIGPTINWSTALSRQINEGIEQNTSRTESDEVL